jgi:CheY-like chemotaxis protein
MTSLRDTNILVVDDDRDSRELLEYFITQEGAVVRKATNAREAMELLLSWTPDVLLLDISMPDMDGYELLQTIRGVNRLRGIPAVAVTAHAFERDKERSEKAGFAMHVSKPYDIAALVKVLGDLVPSRTPEAG